MPSKLLALQYKQLCVMTEYVSLHIYFCSVTDIVPHIQHQYLTLLVPDSFPGGEPGPSIELWAAGGFRGLEPHSPSTPVSLRPKTKKSYFRCFGPGIFRS